MAGALVHRVHLARILCQLKRVHKRCSGQSGKILHCEDIQDDPERLPRLRARNRIGLLSFKPTDILPRSREGLNLSREVTARRSVLNAFLFMVGHRLFHNLEASGKLRHGAGIDPECRHGVSECDCGGFEEHLLCMVSREHLTDHDLTDRDGDVRAIHCGAFSIQDL